MFLRTQRNVTSSGTYEYLQVVESFREGGRVRQRVLARLGRLDKLRESGDLDRLIAGLIDYSGTAALAKSVRTEGVQAREARSWGPALVFGRLWENQGLPELLRGLSADRRFRFDVERACFALALQRLCQPGSDLQGAEWLGTIEAPGCGELELQHLYRAVGFLHDVREELEVGLFHRDRGLFDRAIDVLFIDTTSIAVHCEPQTNIRRRGYSRDHRPDLPQIVLCVAVDGDGWPVAWDILPGNTADTTAMRALVTRLRERFQIGRVVVVADRGMVSKEMLALLSRPDAPFEYVLGCRMRKNPEVRDVVLRQQGTREKVADNLEVEEVVVEGRRYVACFNPQEAARDRLHRDAIVERARELTSKGGKRGVSALMPHRGYQRFIRIQRGAIGVDEAAVQEDALYDGRFVLTTNTSMPAADVARTYRSLWRVERTFRETKSTLEVRPVYHHTDAQCIGHIVACFLALRLEVDLQRKLEAQGRQTPWPSLMRDLNELRAVILDMDGQRYRLRTDLRGHAHQAFAAAGLRPPPHLEHLGPSPSPSTPADSGP
jgi:hypothetical protein